MGAERPGLRALARLLAAALAYLALNAAWLAAGLDRVYDQLVMRAATLLLPGLVHFPIGSSSLAPVEIHNQGHALVLTLACALAATAPAPLARLARYGAIAASIALSHVVALALQLHIGLAVNFQQKTGVALLLPWELTLLRRGFQLLFAYGTQIGPFLAVALAVASSAGPALVRRFGVDASIERPPRRRPILAVTSAVVIALAVTGGAAWWIRERDERHGRAHAVVGDLLLERRQGDVAEGQYRAALRAAGSNGRTWFMLASAVGQQGERQRALRVAETALDTVDDPAWRARLERAREQFGAAGPRE
jgi:hypothetical protein